MEPVEIVMKGERPERFKSLPLFTFFLREELLHLKADVTNARWNTVQFGAAGQLGPRKWVQLDPEEEVYPVRVKLLVTR